jgi:polyvinyl alcohol dehydrogenase (cytochrome)
VATCWSAISAFVDSEINAFNPTTGALLGTIPVDPGSGNTPGGLWSLQFGIGGMDGDPNTLYFTDGINGEAHGLFAALSVAAVPEPSTLALLCTGVLSLCALRWRRRSARPRGASSRASAAPAGIDDPKFSRSTAKERNDMLKTMQRFCWLFCAALTIPSSIASAQSNDWPMFGQNVQNTASNDVERTISTSNVARLAPKWVATTGGDVSARAAVVGGAVYFPDFGGNLWALNADTGAVIWQHQLSFYGLPAGTVSRTSPAVQDDTLYIGTQAGADLLAINAKTGDLRWKTQLDTNSGAVLTASPAVFGGVVYTGVSGVTQEVAAANNDFVCCSFRGSAVAVNARTGAILWKTFMTPSGYTGTSVWGSNPVVDARRNSVFIGTGNNYTTPTAPAYVNCILAGGTQKACLSRNDHVDSVVALDADTGAIRWSQRLSDGDDWNVACSGQGTPTSPVGTNCPIPAGTDFDFGSAPNEFSGRLPGKLGNQDIIGAGQKAGVYWAFDPDTGDFLWGTQVGPGSTLGGIEWGSATDGERIYVAIANADHLQYAAGTGVGTAGSWSALDPNTGEILWQTPDPNAAVDIGPMTVANGVVYAPSTGAATASTPNMFALNAKTGKVLWSFPAGGSVNAGAVVVDGTVYWGSGYGRLGFVAGQNKFFAFSLGGK